MIRPRNQTKDLLLSITRNCQTLNNQTHRKEPLEFSLNKSRQSFHFNSPIQTKADWMIGLTSLEVYNSFFNINTTNKKIELYTDNYDEFSFEELKDELEEILSISHITLYYLQHEKLGLRIIEAYRKTRMEKSNTGAYIISILGYAWSPFRDFEMYLRIVVGLDEDDNQLILKQYTSNFVT